MIKRLLGATMAAAICLLGLTPMAQAQVAPSAPGNVLNLHSAYEHALAHAKPGRISGIVYARGHQPKAASTSTAAPKAIACAEPNCPLTYNGGPVEHHPRIYLLLWGPAWTTNSGEKTSAGYLQNFYRALGVRPQDNWSTITSQYTDATGFPTFNGSQYAGAFYDTSTPPKGTTDAQFAAEADAFASAHKLTTDTTDDQVIIATQSGTCPQDFFAPSCYSGTGYYCAYHDYSGASGVTFTNLPYLLDSQAGCGENIIPNGTRGAYDGFSIVGGHEYAETVTDPQAGNGWLDNNDSVSGGEIGDKCAWVYPGTSNPDLGLVTLSTGAYAMQPLWSNSSYAGSGQGCPMAASPDSLSVTNPGGQTGTVGTPASLQVQATSSSGAQLAYSATGLPPGLSIDSATGLISGTPTTTAVNTVTLTGFDTTGAIGSASFTWADSQPPGAYTPVNPTRVLDTRNGTGGYTGAVGAGKTISLQVTGVGSVPSSGVTAVVLNVTAISPTASSYVTVYPDGEARPVASNLNFTKGEVIPNLVTVPIINGKVDFYNFTGSVYLAADLAGYYTTGGSGSLLTGLGPVRMLDTRNGTGGYSAPVGAGQSISLQVTGVDGVPSSGVTAVVLNVTAVNATSSSYVTVYPGQTTRPLASNLNFTKGDVFPNLVIVPVGSDGTVDFYNNTGSVDLIADLSGYYSASGARFASLGPVRTLDTRNGTGGHTGPVGAGQSISLQVAGVDGVPPSGVTAVVLNVTAVNATSSSYVTVYPDGAPKPLASNLNFTKGEVFPNLVIVPVINGKVDFYNNSGQVDLIADLAGYFTG